MAAEKSVSTWAVDGRSYGPLSIRYPTQKLTSISFEGSSGCIQLGKTRTVLAAEDHCTGMGRVSVEPGPKMVSSMVSIKSDQPSCQL